jgi:molybdopterin molybdotransferase
MLEHSQITGTGELEVMRSVAPLENILQVGEDVQPGQLILGKGKKIRPEEMGGCFALGIQKINCYARPRIGILSSGDEVITPDKSPLPGQIRDINSFSLSALVQTAGGEPIQYGILPDQADVFETGLFNALQQSDFVIITAGSSASTRDLTARVIQKMGKPGVLVHGVNIKPGKPTILAICNGKPIIGLPGNPVSAMVIARIFAIPVIQQLAGNQYPTISPSIPARLNVNLASQAGREDWIPVKLQKTSEGWNAEPIFFKSNLIFSLVQADGLICIPPESNGIPIGQIVSVLPL